MISHRYAFFLLQGMLFLVLREVVAAKAGDLPAVILVPGAFHRAMVYEKVAQLLHQDNYLDVESIELPSVGTVVGRELDNTLIRERLTRQLQKGKDVILVGNSYGATVIGEVVGSLRNRSAVRSNHDTQGRILGLIMLSGFIPYISEVEAPNSKPAIRRIAPPFFRFDGTSKVFWDNDLVNYPPEETFYNASEDDKKRQWASMLTFSSFDALNQTARYIPYTGDFRTLYVIGEYDKAIPPAWAKTFINQPGAQFEVDTIDGDHTPMLSRPQKVVEIIRAFAGESL